MQEEVTLAAYKNQQKKIERLQKFVDQNRVKAGPQAEPKAVSK